MRTNDFALDYVNSEDGNVSRTGMYVVASAVVAIAFGAWLLCQEWTRKPMLLPVDATLNVIASSGWCKWLVSGGIILLITTLGAMTWKRT